jgi:hypothetical protein
VTGLSRQQRQRETERLWEHVQAVSDSKHMASLPGGKVANRTGLLITRSGCGQLVSQGWSLESYRAFTDGAALVARSRGLVRVAQDGFRAWCGQMLDRWSSLPFTLSAEWLAALVIAGPDKAWTRWSNNEGKRLPTVWADLGALGPLAWAAGLSVADARVQQEAGDLTAERLRMLAALRGYTLP